MSTPARALRSAQRGEAAPEADGKRGREKRRQVLACVRQRAEELQP